MSAWMQLFKKEFRLGLPALLFTLIGLLVVWAIAFYIGVRSGHGLEALMVVSFALIFPHVLYLVCYMLVSLQREKKKMHLWLQNPMPGYALLIAKFSSGLVAMTVTLALTCIVAIIGIATLPNYMGITNVFTWSSIIKIGLFTIVNIYLIAIYFATWVMFFWMIFTILLRKLGGLLGSVVGIILLVVLLNLGGYFQGTSLFHTLTQWGAIPLTDALPMPNMMINSQSLALNSGFQDVHLYLGNYIFKAVVAIILFAASCWMLDRKVEV